MERQRKSRKGSAKAAKGQGKAVERQRTVKEKTHLPMANSAAEIPAAPRNCGDSTLPAAGNAGGD